MAARFCLSVLTGVVGALVLAGCGTLGTAPLSGPGAMAAVAPNDCSSFAAHIEQLKLAPPAQTPVSAENLTPDQIATSQNPAEADHANEPSEPEEHPTLKPLPLFSATPSGLSKPAGWQPWTVNRNKIPTRYTLTEVDQRMVLHAEADNSASGLYVPLVGREPGMLNWTWKTRDVIRSADNSLAPREDAPLRIFVAFDGDKGSLSLKDQLMYEMARLTTGREMPYATLMYIWGGRKPEGSVVSNPHTDRVRMIVVDSGTRHTGEWRCHRRDLRADYRKAFGADPGKVVAIGIMTDTDNTKSRAESWYGDIALD
ncbi:DUF3047 domain-containing protein [Cupriavidus sp. CV2]|uniref:DUF3047 domain-containing protein n=1 Tax=Cupriavidus ulmosensis TaxID=3065913 RepID=UPI00296B2E89|nr:DUF3047 domain-containing protein [Cupriavidus sp. CV2]MDW3688232.1 DUF3047 domain-containing protein [Cupriavidus sp. CV2]